MCQASQSVLPRPCRKSHIVRTGDRLSFPGLLRVFLSFSTSPRPFFSSQNTKTTYLLLYAAFSMEKFPVKLYVYDISRGLARQLSPLLLGKFLRWMFREKIVYSKYVVFFARLCDSANRLNLSRHKLIKVPKINRFTRIRRLLGKERKQMKSIFKTMVLV